MTTVRRAAAAILITALVACEPSVVEQPSPSVRPSPAPTTSLDPVTTDPPFRAVSWPAGDGSACGVQDYAGLLGRVEATAERRVVFTLCDPDAAFLARIAHPSLAILDSTTIDSLAGDVGDHAPIAGTGPFRVQRWTEGVELELVRDERYVGSAPAIETIILRWDELGGQRLVELHSKTVDGIDAPDPGDAATIRSDPGLAFVARPRLATIYLGFTPAAPFERAQVRSAIAIAVDRTQLVDEVMSPGSLLADHVTPCTVPGGCSGKAWPGTDPQLAREALAAARFDLAATYPIHVPRLTTAGGTSLPALAGAFAEQLSERLGVRAEVDILDRAAFASALAAGELPGMHLAVVETELADPSMFLGLPVRATGAFGQPDAELVAAVEDAGRATDAAAREALFAKAGDRIQATVPLIPIGHPGDGAAFLADVQGVHASPLGVEALGAMQPGDRRQLVWMQATEPPSLYCADERGLDAYRACALVTESLYGFELGSTTPSPRLAEACTPSEDATVWTCDLREDVRFHDGARFDAADVVASYAAMWDEGHATHAARPEGSFRSWAALFRAYLPA